ncbi:gag-pol polyprotein [Trifolium medium]|uniref:Gag-pol polyprotein n=1 Tax=Trifolium medium TaxID=97028 RepID=A0A392M9C2_9FABA|nr:gag-pol polyprotein [Trifolium medium]
MFATEKPNDKTDDEWTLLHRQLSAVGIKFDDEIQGLFPLGSLPGSWETFRMSLSNSAVDGVLSMNLVKRNILNEEMRRESQDSPSQSKVLVTESS